MNRNRRQKVPRSSNPFSLLDVDDAPDSADYPTIEARKVMSDEEQRSVGGPVVAPWAGYIANGRMTRTLSQVWTESGETVAAFMERIFEIEYLGLELNAFEGLPAWAVPLPEDFDEEKHIGWATHKYVLERRLHVSIEIDPSPKQAWLKPLLDPTMENWIRDSRKRLYAINKMWEAYDFLCHWALDIARTRITCPILYALDNYTQDSIRNLRLSVSESVKLYEEVMGSNHASSIGEDSSKKDQDKGKETASTDGRSTSKDDALDDEGEDNRFRRTERPYVSKGRGPRSSNLSIRYPPPLQTPPPTPASSVSAPRQQFVFTRRRPEKSDPGPRAPLAPAPVSASSAPQTEPRGPEEAVAQMAEATRAGVRADSFKAWSHFFSAQLALYANNLSKNTNPNPSPGSGSGSGSGSGWPSIDEAFMRFLQELCERFPDHAADLQQWVRAESQRVEEYKDEREKHARADAMLHRVLADLKE
ncbi:hypothetical protein K445DRAFT_362460 [Daldinia sp. EC12]|nr:hypothetical protein K445DRAFT_362460 [Daldinia sp. EC12]